MIPEFKYKGLEIISYKNFLWIVLAIVPEHKVESTTELKERYHADIVLRRRQQLYVCDIIEEPEIISE